MLFLIKISSQISSCFFLMFFIEVFLKQILAGKNSCVFNRWYVILTETIHTLLQILAENILAEKNSFQQVLCDTDGNDTYAAALRFRS